MINSITRSTILTKTQYRKMSAGNPRYSDMELIATVTLTGSNEAVFTNIPQTYKHLQLRYSLRSIANTTQDFTYGRINGDSASNYVSHQLYGTGSSAVSDYTTLRGYFWMPSMPALTATSNCYGGLIMDILDYTSTSKNKTLRGFGGYSAATGNHIGLASSVWLSTAAITQINTGTGNNYSAIGSRISLYGIKG